MSRPAASVVLFAERPELEVFLVRRSRRLEFFGGYLAFPGGSVEEADAAAATAGAQGLDPAERQALACAARELAEEVGVDLAGAALDASGLRPLVRFVTPRFSRRRYDTRFYLLRSRGEPRVRGPELDGGGWWRPGGLLEAWRRGRVLVAPPALVILRALDEHGLEEGRRRLQGLPAEFEGSGTSIPWTPGIEVLPFHSPPLPRSIPANTFFLGGRRFVVLDPSPRRPEGVRHLLSALEGRVAAGDRLEAVVLTHHHPDHVAGLDPVLERFGVPLWAHRATGELLGRRLDRCLEDGEWIDLSPAPDGAVPWGLRCLFTPGHAAGHLAFHDPHYGTVVAGDLVSTLVSMYVGSPGGDLRAYFDSLERMRRLGARILFPAHGMPSVAPEELLEATAAHRRERLEEVAVLLGDRPLAVEALARRVYRDADARLRPLFVRATRAALEHLEREGRARPAGEDLWRRG